MSTETYNCFVRTWWEKTPNGLRPQAGRKTYKLRDVSIDQARDFCKQWNSENDPGELSRKCEFESN